MKESRLQLIKDLAGKIKMENSCKGNGSPFKGLERQAIQLVDREYVSIDKKSIDNVSELNFN